MNHDLILIRYGELSLKTRYVRNYFETTLIKNIKKVFKKHKTSCTIQREWGRIYLHTDQIPQGVQLLRRIFGITSVSPVVETKTDMDLISKTAVNISKPELTKQKTFAIKTTRTGKHNFTSQDVSVRIGSDIAKATNAGVNLTKPDFKLFIEIRDNKTYLFTEKIRGTGGLPMGTQGKTLALIDTPKSLLAAWYLMRRGCKIIYLKTKKIDKTTLESFTSKWDVTPETIDIDTYEENLYNTLNKLAMEKNCDAIVTNHSLNESLEVLSDIKSMKKHIQIPVLHPLISMDEKTINQKCKEIGIQI